jgi:hypothetical protein
MKVESVGEKTSDGEKEEDKLPAEKNGNLTDEMPSDRTGKWKSVPIEEEIQNEQPKEAHYGSQPLPLPVPNSRNKSRYALGRETDMPQSQPEPRENIEQRLKTSNVTRANIATMAKSTIETNCATGTTDEVKKDGEAKTYIETKTDGVAKRDGEIKTDVGAKIDGEAETDVGANADDEATTICATKVNGITETNGKKMEDDGGAWRRQRCPRKATQVSPSRPTPRTR